jgi:choline dehydrogenase
MEVGYAKAVYSRVEHSAADRPPANCSVRTRSGAANPLFSEERSSRNRLNDQTCTAKMGRDSISVVDAQLKVHKIENLRIADGSITSFKCEQNAALTCRRSLAERAQVRDIACDEQTGGLTR